MLRQHPPIIKHQPTVSIFSIDARGMVTWANQGSCHLPEEAGVGQLYLDSIDSTGTRHHLHQHFTSFCQDRLSIIVTDPGSAFYGYRIILTALLSNAGLSYIATHEPLNLDQSGQRERFEAATRPWRERGWVDSGTFRATCPEISGPSPTPVPFTFADTQEAGGRPRRIGTRFLPAGWPTVGRPSRLEA
jgi:hypothetical protein